ncbi:MAG: hypothetical protein QOF61_1354 [Acidobacteriota bacterium]|nr:hypothetical protein [Acidobacteriota bacterium]
MISTCESRLRRLTKAKSVRLLIAVILVIVSQTIYAQTPRPAAPRVFLVDARNLSETRRRVLAGDKTYTAALRRLEADAQKALDAGLFSVTSKEVTPPGGDKHDYMSQAPYFWRNPKTPDGLPYVRRDGERNPEINKITDHRNLDQMADSVESLALAYYFRGEEAYASRAAQLLRAWFLDPATRMNPNLQYAQYVPGVNTGRGIGLIETRGLTRVADSVGLLSGSKAWTESDQRGIVDWYSKFLQWMLESKNGKEENAAENNHGTWFDVQAASFALFTGKTDLAKSILETAKQKRIARQVEPDGREPLELTRTKSWDYSIFNLDALVTLAELGEHVGVDLWHYQTADGRSIRRALEYLYPFAAGEKKWDYQQLGGVEPQTLFPLMRRAALAYDDGKFRALMSNVPASDSADRNRLLRARN